MFPKAVYGGDEMRLGTKKATILLYNEELGDGNELPITATVSISIDTPSEVWSMIKLLHGEEQAGNRAEILLERAYNALKDSSDIEIV